MCTEHLGGTPGAMSDIGSPRVQNYNGSDDVLILSSALDYATTAVLLLFRSTTFEIVQSRNSTNRSSVVRIRE